MDNDLDGVGVIDDSGRWFLLLRARPKKIGLVVDLVVDDVGSRRELPGRHLQSLSLSPQR